MVLGAWYVFRTKRAWVRAITALIAIVVSPFLGFALVMEAVEHRNAAAGIVALPMVLVWMAALVVALVGESVRVYKARHAKKSNLD
jgi:hypothetical protein